MSKTLAVGTKVILLDVPTRERNVNPGWSDNMTKFIGRVGTIKKLANVNGRCYRVRFNKEENNIYGHEGYLYRHSWLKVKVEKKKNNRFDLVLLSINNEVKKK